jgi:hypothetical protein
MALSNLQVQTSVVAYLKSLATVIAEVSSDEIREDQWQGSVFSYPNIRVRMRSNRPVETNCDVSDVMFSILIFSELDSSIEAERIAGIIDVALHARSFERESVRLSLWRENLIPAIRIDERTWRSEIQFQGTATG